MISLREASFSCDNLTSPIQPLHDSRIDARSCMNYDPLRVYVPKSNEVRTAKFAPPPTSRVFLRQAHFAGVRCFCRWRIRREVPSLRPGP
jgi:hypothetical protein